MPSPTPETLRLAERYQLVLAHAAARGTAGDRMGRATGSSLELHERRTYAPGDDLRHLDWRAFARTDQFLVRQYREEILPRVDVIVDGSRSMAVEPAKARTCVDLAALFALAARAAGHHVGVVLLAARPERVEIDRLLSTGIEFTSSAPAVSLLDATLPQLRAGSLRVVVSDFLFPHDPAALVRTLALHGHVALVQVLGRSDVEPPENAALRLIDAESDVGDDLVLDRRTVGVYRERLRRLGDALETECRRSSARFASVVADADVDRLCRERLVPAGVLAPA